MNLNYESGKVGDYQVVMLKRIDLVYPFVEVETKGEEDWLVEKKSKSTQSLQSK